MSAFQRSDAMDDADRREFLKAGTASLITALWGVEPASAQEKRMTDSKKSNTPPSVLTYEDVRAVSPALGNLCTSSAFAS